MWENILSLLVIAATMVLAVALYSKNGTTMRRLFLLPPVLYISYNVSHGALGGIGSTTGLFPALTLGCGAVGGSSSSNNISPLDLINIRRVAWDRESPNIQVNGDLVELLTAKILERLP